MNDRKLSREIEKRLTSDEWDYRIASGVMRHKRRERRIIISAVSGVAASVIVAVTLFVYPVQTNTAEESFVSDQVTGVYNKVYNHHAATDPVDDALDDMIAIR